MLDSYGLINKKRDLSDIMSTAISQTPRFISLFLPRDAAKSTKHEWLEDVIGPRQISSSAATGTGPYVLTVSAEDYAKVLLGTMLVIHGDPRVFQVTAKASGTDVTIAEKLANGSTTAPAGAAATIFDIIGTPQKEGTSNGDGENGNHQSGTNYNYTQIMRKEVVITGTAGAVNVYGDVDNRINYQTQFQIQEGIRDMNRSAIFGVRTEGNGSTINSQAGGLYQFAANGSGILEVDANTGTALPLSSTLVNDAAELILAEGGDPTAVLGHPSQIRTLSSDMADKVRILNGDAKRGNFVASIVNDVTGKPMTVVADYDFPANDAWVLDPAGLGVSWLRALGDEDATDKGFDGIKRKILGEYTFEFKNATKRACRIKELANS